MMSAECDDCVASAKRLVTGCLAGLCVVVLWSGAGWQQAHADDWALESDDDRDERIVERYREMLEDNPVEGMALQRLLNHVGRGAGLDGLIDEYRQRVQSQPQAHNLRLVLGHLLKARGDHAEAYEQYDEALQIDRDDSLGWLSRGAVQLLMGERRAAMEDFEEALSREGDDERRRELLQELGELSFSEREFDRGVEFFEQLVSESPRDQFLIMEYASLLVQYRQFDEAIAQYEVLRELVAGDPRQKATLLRDKADVYEMMGDPDSALAIYEEVNDLVRADGWLAREVRHSIVNVYRQAGRLDDFIDDYGSQWRRGDTEQRMFVADVHAELGMLEEALEQYQALARRSPRSVEPREKAIRVLERLGRDDELDGAYRDLMRASPDTPDYAFELADHYMQIGDRAAAQEVLEEVGQSFSQRSYILLELADHYARWNFVDSARETYETVLARETDDDAVLIDVGDFYFDRGDRHRALEVWQKLPDSQLGEREGSRRMAETFVERGVVSEGIATFERLIEESPEDERLLRSMARALERGREWEDAMERWEQLLAVTEDAGRKGEARTRIVELHERTQRLRARMRDWSRDFDEGQGQEAVDAGFFLAESHLRVDELDDAQLVLATMDDEHELSHDERTTLLLTQERIHLRADRFDEAIDILVELAEHAPAMSSEVLDRKTSHALAARDGERAVEYASRATQANPNDASAQESMGDVYRGLDDQESAIRHYRTATDIDPRAHDARLKLGELLVEMGRDAEAEEALMEVIEEASDTQLIRDAGAKMLDMAGDDEGLDALEVRWTPLIFRMPIDEAHARLMFDLYDLLVGPLLMSLYHGAPEQRVEARERLYELGGRAAPLMVEQLQQDSTALRIRTMRMVAEMEVDLAASQVARMITDDDETLRVMAIATAARLGDGRFVDPLRESMREGSATVRHLSIWALGYIDDERAMQALREVADTDVEGTDSLLATVGLWGADDAESKQVIEQSLARLIDDPSGVNRDRASVLLATAATTIAGGGGGAYREYLLQLMSDAPGRAGLWAARLLGGYGDAEAATELWHMALGDNSTLARRGESGLIAMTAPSSTLERRWDYDIRHFDWADGDFEAEALLRDTGRRWAQMDWESDAEERWSDAVATGLTDILSGDAEEIDVDAVMSRMGDQLRGQRSPLWWDLEQVRNFSHTLIDTSHFDELSVSTQTSLRLFAGHDVAALEEVEELDETELIALMNALTLTGATVGEEAVESLFGEALQREEATVRRRALRNLSLLDREGAVSDGLAEQVLAALRDDDRAVQLAAVRSAGHLRLGAAREDLVALEKEAPPGLRRAVRQTRRVLEEE